MTEYREGDLVEIISYGNHACETPYPQGTVVSHNGHYIRVQVTDDRLFRYLRTANCNEYELKLRHPRPSLRQLWSQT